LSISFSSFVTFRAHDVMLIFFSLRLKRLCRLRLCTARVRALKARRRWRCQHRAWGLLLYVDQWHFPGAERSPVKVVFHCNITFPFAQSSFAEPDVRRSYVTWALTRLRWGGEALGDTFCVFAA